MIGRQPRRPARSPRRLCRTRSGCCVGLSVGWGSWVDAPVSVTGQRTHVLPQRTGGWPRLRTGLRGLPPTGWLPGGSADHGRCRPARLPQGRLWSGRRWPQPAHQQPKWCFQQAGGDQPAGLRIVGGRQRPPTGRGSPGRGLADGSAPITKRQPDPTGFRQGGRRWCRRPRRVGPPVPTRSPGGSGHPERLRQPVHRRKSTRPKGGRSRPPIVGGPGR